MSSTTNVEICPTQIHLQAPNCSNTQDESEHDLVGLSSAVKRLIGREPFQWSEQVTPVNVTQCHLLDLISDYGVWKTEPKKPALGTSTTATNASGSSTKVRLYCIPSIMDVVNIDPMEETFTVKFLLYLLWSVDFATIGMQDVAIRAKDSGHFINMTTAECQGFAEKSPMPGVTVFNAVETYDTREADIRVYGGGNVPGFTFVMWNRSMHVKIRERWELQLFPFDIQDLSINLRLNDTRSWDYFDLTVCSVQFHREALTLTEFYPLTPQIARETPAHKATKVRLRVQRIPNYYLQNIVLILFLLSLLGPLAFVLDIDALGDRLSTILTLLLTAVAFKYVISSALPKVPYNTLMDYFILAATVSLVLSAFLCAVPKLLIPRYGVDVANRVNKGLGFMCLTISLTTPMLWIVVSHWLSRKGASDCDHIKLVSKKNWYHFQFSPTPFMQLPMPNKTGISSKSAASVVAPSNSSTSSTKTS